MPIQIHSTPDPRQPGRTAYWLAGNRREVANALISLLVTAERDNPFVFGRIAGPFPHPDHGWHGFADITVPVAAPDPAMEAA